MLQIRKIKPEDLSFVLELNGRENRPWGKMLSNIENFLICEDDNVKCGCGCLVLFGDRGIICWVAVIEDYRRKKLGSAIVKALLNIADLRGAEEVYSAGICGAFLEALGFKETEDTEMGERIKELIGDTGISKLYKVSLKGYFKCCSQ